MLAGQQHGAGPYAQPAQQQQQHSIPRGLSSSITQRIVRAAAMGLRDLHKMAGHLHCDMKTNNLLVRTASNLLEVCAALKQRCSVCCNTVTAAIQPRLVAF